MKYTFGGTLREVVRPGIDEPVVGATVRLYRGDGGPELAARAARLKQTSSISNEKRIEAKAGRLLAAGDTDAVGNQFDIAPADTCTCVVWMSARRRLHTGESQVSEEWTRLIPFYCEA